MSYKRKRTSSSDDTNVKTLYVGVMKSKFPNFITSKHLRKHFAEFEEDVVSAIIVRDPDTKESKGYGFVTFSSHEATVRAFHKLKGTKLNDKFLLYINYQKKDDSSETSTTPHQSSELYFRAMKSKLPGYINKKHILEHFAEFEAFITSAVIVRDPDTKISKGFGFVRFSSEYIAGFAQKKLHGSMLQGKFALHVEFRKPSVASVATSQTPSDSDSELFDSETDSSEGESDSEESTTGNTTLYVSVYESKFPNYVNSGHLEEHFSDFRKHIISARIMRNRKTHTTKGYGFVRFTTSAEAEKAMKKLRGTKMLGKFSLFINFKKPTLNKSSSTLSISHSSSFSKSFPPQIQMSHSKTYQLRPEAISLTGLQQAFQGIGSQNQTRIEKQAGQAVIISGSTMEGVEQSWEEIKRFVEHNLTVTKSVEVSGECARFLQTKHASYLQELRAKCEIHMPSNLASKEKASITVKGKISNTKDVLDKLKKLSSKCHIEKFLLLCPKSCAKLWHNRWDRFKRDIEKNPNIQVDFETTQVATTEAGTNRVTVTIVGIEKPLIRDIKSKVLQDENCSIMATQTLILPSDQLQALSSNLQQLQLKLEESYSTSLSINKQTNFVELRTPSSIKINLVPAKQEVMRFVERLSSTLQTVVIEHHFEDIVVGLLLTTKQKYYDEIKKEAAKTSVMIHDQKKPKLGFQLRGNSKDVQFVVKKITSLSLAAKNSISQTQLIVESSSKTLLFTDDFLKFQADLEDQMCTCVFCPSQKNLLRQMLFKTPNSLMVTLQLCVSEFSKENVDAIVFDPIQLNAATNITLNKVFSKSVSSKKFPETGSAACHKTDSLQCKGFIIVQTPTCNKHSKDADLKLLLSTYENALISAESNGYGNISFLLQGLNKKISDDMSVLGILHTVNLFCEKCPKTIIHTIRILISSEISASCIVVFDKRASSLSYAMSDCISASKSISSSSLSTTCSSVSLQWQWRDDRKLFTPYSQEITEKLNKKKLKDPLGNYSFFLNGNYYSVDLSKMVQTNIKTNFSREVRCIPTSTPLLSSKSSSNVTVQWYYMDDEKVLTPYTKSDSEEIERMRNGLSSNAFIIISGRRYVFDFTNMKQINYLTKHSRHIERNERTQSSASESVHKLVITIRGPKDNLIEAKKRVERKLKELLLVTDIPLPMSASSQLLQKLCTVISKHSVEYKIKSANAASKGITSQQVFEIKGPESAVHKAKTDVQAELLKFHSESPTIPSSVTSEYPPEWEHQSKTVELFVLSRFSKEQIKVVSKLNETLPRAKIVRVQRIQNKWLWQKYEQCRKRTEKKNDGKVNEMLLFHGSRASSAEKIYASEEGFDMRFCTKGMWGVANYFAVNASYSDNYAYVNPADGTKELLLAKVLTGDSYISKPDKELRMPPEKPEKSRGNIDLMQLRYDTVNGIANRSQVFMTYSNDRAYPAYLITYSIAMASPFDI